MSAALNSPAGFDAAPAAARWRDEGIICFDLMAHKIELLRSLNLGRTADISAAVIVRDFLLRELIRARRREKAARRAGR